MAKSSGTKTEKVERKTINSVVSHEFKEAFDAWAEDQGWTTATALRYLAEKAVGRNPEMPKSESQSDRYILSTAVDVPVKEVIDSETEGKGGVAQFLREIAANACGYDLSQEPERVNRGGARHLLEEERERTASQNVVLLGLRKYMTPEQYIAAITEAGKTPADLGLSDDDLTEEAFAALR